MLQFQFKGEVSINSVNQPFTTGVNVWICYNEMYQAYTLIKESEVWYCYDRMYQVYTLMKESEVWCCYGEKYQANLFKKEVYSLAYINKNPKCEDQPT